MKIILKIRKSLLDTVHKDLARPHDFAFERVGFLVGQVGKLTSGVVILPYRYIQVPDHCYVEGSDYGATVNAEGFRVARQAAYSENVSIFHVHKHEHLEEPWFSRTDLREMSRFVPDFFGVRPHMPHGGLVLSENSVAGLCWLPGYSKPLRIKEFTVVGSDLSFMGRRNA